MSRRGPYRSQRALDLVGLVLVGLPALVVGGACALAVWLTSRGPVLFRQERVGRDGRPFVMLKFRTMVEGDNPVIPDPSRITGVGRVLRRTSLDELPNLINVARGEMSLVGPRPTLAYQVERYDQRQRLRLRVRPGLTGLAQVRGRNALSWSERLEHDLEYVDTQSLWVDLRVLMATVGVALTGAGVEGHAPDDPLSADPGSVDLGRSTGSGTGPERPDEPATDRPAELPADRPSDPSGPGGRRDGGPI